MKNKREDISRKWYLIWSGSLNNLIISIFFAAIASLISCNAEPERPNVILILADDFGYMDCQAYAQKTLGVEKSNMYYETPHLDRLAAEGFAFSKAYANQLCSPTRAAILTGKYAGRHGFTTATAPCDTYYNLDKRASIEDQPFFLYFCPFAVHGPWQAKSEDSTYFAGKSTRGWNGHHDPRYAGMIRGLDNSVGRILEKLEETGLEEDVERQYWPPHNPDYDPAEEVRANAPFVDLYEAFINGRDVVALANTD